MKLPSHVRHVPETGSTNQDLLDLLRDGVHETTAILADHQTAGRGRLGRVWHDESVIETKQSRTPRPQAMMGSVAIEWDVPSDPAVPLVPFAAGLATLDLVQTVLGDESGVGLGWPNDVIVKRDDLWRKLAGILVESAPLPDTSGLVVVVGVGLNIWPVVSAPSDVNVRAVSLAELAPPEPNSPVEMPSNVEAFIRLQSALRERISDLRADRVAMMSSYRARCLTIGETVSFETTNGTREGVADDVADTGEILIRTPGDTVSVSVGDVRVI